MEGGGVILEHQSISALLSLYSIREVSQAKPHREAAGVNPDIYRGCKASSRRSTRTEDLLYHGVGLGHHTHQPCNHLVCFHIHSYEAVICPAPCEAGGWPHLLSCQGPRQPAGGPPPSASGPRHHPASYFQSVICNMEIISHSSNVARVDSLCHWCQDEIFPLWL